MPKKPVAPQSLEEMIASASGSPSARARSGATSQSSDLNGGLAPPVGDAPVVEAQNGHGTTPGFQFPANQMIRINVPATLFEFARRIANLEMVAGGQPGAEETMAAVVQGMAKLEKIVENIAQKQADIPAVVSNLSNKITDLEKSAKGWEEISMTVDPTVSGPLYTIDGLEKKLGEESDTRTTFAALTRRITELEMEVNVRSTVFANTYRDLEKMAEERAAVQDGKIKGLETTIETQAKMAKERVAAQDVKIKNLEATVETLEKTVAEGDASLNRKLGILKTITGEQATAQDAKIKGLETTIETQGKMAKEQVAAQDVKIKDLEAAGASLNRKLGILKTITGEQATAQDAKMKNLEATVETLANILEAKGLKAAGDLTG
ncbi:hypothetical protein IMZ48_41335 [Candidatus Bathyarchaeota archaeon]|nr:hypothetical protein [Candidatus Bathyarchaeota archaeon]